MNKKNMPIIAIGCVLILGVCVVLYPIVSAILSKMTESATIASYQKTVENLPGEDVTKLIADAQKYNQSISGSVLTDAFSGSNKVDTNYDKLLNINDVMGYLEIPKIKVYLPIFHNSTEEVLQKGIGHLPNSSLPVGGPNTHAVLTGHRGLPSATLLTNLDQLDKGDEFYVHILDEVFAYKVDQIKVVNPDNTSDLRIQPGKDYVTLVTCTPYGINTQRLLVRGERTGYTAVKKPVQTSLLLTNEAVIVPTVFIFLAVLPAVLFIRRKRRVRK